MSYREMSPCSRPVWPSYADERFRNFNQM